MFVESANQQPNNDSLNSCVGNVGSRVTTEVTTHIKPRWENLKSCIINISREIIENMKRVTRLAYKATLLITIGFLLQGCFPSRVHSRYLRQNYPNVTIINRRSAPPFSDHQIEHLEYVFQNWDSDLTSHCAPLTSQEIKVYNFKSWVLARMPGPTFVTVSPNTLASVNKLDGSTAVLLRTGQPFPTGQSSNIDLNSTVFFHEIYHLFCENEDIKLDKDPINFEVEVFDTSAELQEKSGLMLYYKLIEPIDYEGADGHVVSYSENTILIVNILNETRVRLFDKLNEKRLRDETVAFNGTEFSESETSYDTFPNYIIAVINILGIPGYESPEFTLNDLYRALLPGTYDEFITELQSLNNNPDLEDRRIADTIANVTFVWAIDNRLIRFTPVTPSFLKIYVRSRTPELQD